MNNKNELKGPVLVLISAVFFATYGVWSRLMMGVFGEFSQAWTRAIILLLFIVPFGFLTKQFKKIKKQDLKWFAVIAMAGGFNQAPYYFGFKHLSVGTATLLFHTFLTVGAYVLGKMFFQEKLGMTKYLSLVIAIIGIYLIYSFSLSSSQILPALAVSLAGFMGSVGVVFSKKISGFYSELQIICSYAIVMLFGNFVLSWIMGETLPHFALSLPWLAAVGYAVCLLLANFTVIDGFKYLEPSIGSLIGLMEIILAVMYGIMFFQEKLDSNMIYGGGLIILAMALPEIISIISAKRTKFTLAANN